MKINPELLKMALQRITDQQKEAFVQMPPPGMDPAAAGGGGMPPGMDPAAAGGGGMPPGMDPSMMGGGMPPGMDPAAMGGGMPQEGGDPLAALSPMIQQAVQEAMASQGGGSSAGGGAAKPKVDVGTELMQIKLMLAKVVDAMGIQLPVQELFAQPGGETKAASDYDYGGVSAISENSDITNVDLVREEPLEVPTMSKVADRAAAIIACRRQ